MKKLLLAFLLFGMVLPGQEIAWWKMPMPVAPALAPNVPGFNWGALEEAGVMVALIAYSNQLQPTMTYKFTLRFDREGVEGSATVFSDYPTYIFWVGKVTVKSVKVDILTKFLTLQKDG